ncbi:hypothetical protein AB0M39_19850 [Streptomyces sp. NPDC051907]|uniref:hypothetical protein n=1 Tax=Streptomyces sp. NPDC051907 TaxID=3155284 RepID=UPI00342D5D1D
MLRKSYTRAATLFAATALLAGSPIAASAATNSQAAAAVHGCPSGAVCIYPQDAGWNNDKPSHFYYSYGAHNLNNQFGTHRIFNNQTDGATMSTCTGYNGAGCEGKLPAFMYIDKNLTPINSITLQR